MACLQRFLWVKKKKIEMGKGEVPSFWLYFTVNVIF